MQIRPSTSLYTTLQALNEQNRAQQQRRVKTDAAEDGADSQAQIQAREAQAKQAQIDQAFVQARDFIPKAAKADSAAQGKGGGFAVDPEFSREAPRPASAQTRNTRPGQIVDIRV